MARFGLVHCAGSAGRWLVLRRTGQCAAVGGGRAVGGEVRAPSLSREVRRIDWALPRGLTKADAGRVVL